MTLTRLEFVFCGIGWLFAALSVALLSFALMEIACMSLGLVGIVRISKIVINNEEHWSLCNIVAGAGMTSYFMGAFFTIAQYDPGSQGIMFYGGENFLEGALLAIVYISLYYWALVGLALTENVFWRPCFRIVAAERAWVQDRATRPVIAVGLAVMIAAQLYLMVSGGITLSGIDVTQSARLPIGAELVIDFSDPALAVSAWIIGRWKKPLWFVRLAIISTLCQVPWLGGLGRRYILYGAVMFLIFYFWAGGNRKGRLAIYLAIPTLAVVYVVTKIFVAMRFAGAAYVVFGISPSLSTLYSDALSLLSTNAETVSRLEQENYGSRFFILEYLTTIMDRVSLSSAQFGKLVLISAITCIPSAFFPDKTGMMAKFNWGGEGKGMLNEMLGLPPLDTAWTPFVAGYADFMWLGAVIYPLLLILPLGWLLSRIVRNMRYPTFVVGGLGLCLMEFISTETGVSSYFLAGRTLALIWLIAKTVELLDRPAAGHSHVRR
jgi:hypothetical protein